MKKTLVALAALSAISAFAQSSVQIDGNVDAGYQAWTYKGANQSTRGIGQNGSSTTQINFRGTQDLGGGLKATFRVETDFNVVSNKANTGWINGIDDGSVPTNSSHQITTANATSGGGTFGNGELRVGLESSTLGQVHFGAVNNASFDALMTGQPFGTAIGGGFRGITRTDAGTMASSAVRGDQSVRFNTPVFNGVSGSLLVIKKSTDAATSTTGASSSYTPVKAYDYSSGFNAYDFAGVKEYSAAYNNGPLNARYTVQKTDATGVDMLATANQTQRTLKTLGANYAIGSAWKVFYLRQTYDTTSATTNGMTVNQYSAAYTLGNHVFLATTGSLDSKASTATGKSKLTGLGYDYNLSKTTALYARYDKIDDQAGVLTGVAQMDGTADKTRTRTAVGLRVGF